jgi:hypothetical protein
MMVEILWIAVGLVIGFSLGIWMMVASERRSALRQADTRAQQRALLGLPDRPPARPDSQGSARVFKANIVDRRSDSGMQM